jgi:hypothetical protein
MHSRNKVSVKSGVRWSAQVSISLFLGLARDLCTQRGVMCLSSTCSDAILKLQELGKTMLFDARYVHVMS